MTVQWTEVTDPAGHTLREFTVPFQERLITGAIWLPTDGEPTKLTCFGHGASGDRYQWPIPKLAERLRQAGILGMALDGPMHGLRQPSEGEPRALFVQGLQQGTVLKTMAEDWAQALKIIPQDLGLEVNKTAYFGLSMGSIFGIPFLATRTDDAVATVGLAGVFEGLPHQE